MSINESNKNIISSRIILLSLLRFLLFIAIIFLSAGRLNYWQGWLFCLTVFIMFLTALKLFKGKPGLIKERLNPGLGVKWWDKILLVLFVSAFMAILIVAGLDAGRLRFTPEIPLALYIMGYVFFVLSYSFTFWAMYENKFFSSAVRIQKDRGQHVVETGPYSLIRHPGYLGGILGGINAAIVLGSSLALIPATISAIIFIIRTKLEDTLLKKELPGYADYAKKVKFKLVPGIW